MNGAPRALALTTKAWDLLTTLDRQAGGRFTWQTGTCDGCGRQAFVWDGLVTCVDRRSDRHSRHCPGNGQPPRRAAT